jgi:hypothetical protein
MPPKNQASYGGDSNTEVQKELGESKRESAKQQSLDADGLTRSLKKTG